MNYKNKILQIENCSAEDFIENLVDQITLKIKEECDCCNEANTTSKEWLTTKEACDYFKVSQPTLKRLRERGEGESKTNPHLKGNRCLLNDTLGRLKRAEHTQAKERRNRNPDTKFKSSERSNL